MWKLKSPDLEDAERDLVRALTRRDGGPVFETNAQQRAALLLLYHQDDLTGGKPSSALLGTERGVSCLDDDYTAYDQVQDDPCLVYLRSRLKAGARTCPYCGFGEIYYLVHHLARSVYRALAIYCRNLI